MEYQVSDLKSKPSLKSLRKIVAEANRIVVIDSPRDMEHHFEGRPGWIVRLAKVNVEHAGFHGMTMDDGEKVLYILNSVKEWLA